MTTRTTCSVISNEAVWYCINCHKKCPKCHLSTFTHALKRARHWVTAALVTYGIIWTIYPRIAQWGGRCHRFACSRCTPPACSRLHSPAAWDQGCLEVTAKWYEILIVFSRSRRAVTADVSQLHGTLADGNSKLLKNHLLNVNISLTAALIFTKIGNFVKKVQIFRPSKCNCAKLAIFWRYWSKQWQMISNGDISDAYLLKQSLQLFIVCGTFLWLAIRTIPWTTQVWHCQLTYMHKNADLPQSSMV